MEIWFKRNRGLVSVSVCVYLFVMLFLVATPLAGLSVLLFVVGLLILLGLALYEVIGPDKTGL